MIRNQHYCFKLMNVIKAYKAGEVSPNIKYTKCEKKKKPVLLGLDNQKQQGNYKQGEKTAFRMGENNSK